MDSKADRVIAADVLAGSAALDFSPASHSSYSTKKKCRKNNAFVLSVADFCLKTPQQKQKKKPKQTQTNKPKTTTTLIFHAHLIDMTTSQ